MNTFNLFPYIIAAIILVNGAALFAWIIWHESYLKRMDRGLSTKEIFEKAGK